jgi:glycine betaine/proline transport system ATP-binding protein
MIQIKNLVKKFGSVTALNGVSLDAHDTELICIVGESGCGKSTLLKCISNFIDKDSGEINILGNKTIGTLFQSFALLPHKTVLENIAFPLQVKGKSGVSKAMEMIELVGLQGKENHLPGHLLSNQQQKIAIARACITDPDIWLLDEPFSAIFDPVVRKQMQDIFLKLNKTTLFATHDFNEALGIADKIIIMKDGSIEQFDTPDNILSNPANEYVHRIIVNRRPDR